MGISCSCQGRISKVGAVSTHPTAGTTLLQRRVILTPTDQSAAQKLKDFYEEERKFIPKKIDVYYQSVLSNQTEAVTSIVVKVSHLGPTGVEYLCRVLPFFPQLLELRLWKVGLDPTSVDRLAYYLPFLKQLHVLSLEDNNLNDEAVENICKGFKTMRSLQQLWLGNNLITPVGTACIASSLRLLGQLETLSLDYNCIESLGCTLLCTVLCETKRLQRLSMEYCEVGDEAISHLICLAQVNAPEHLINLKNNRLSRKGCTKLESALGLEHVDLSHQL